MVKAVARLSHPLAAGKNRRGPCLDFAAGAPYAARVMDMLTGTVGVVGVGNMAEALIRGLVHSGIVAPAQVIGSHPRSERGEELTRRYGIGVTTDNREAAGRADILILAVKPQVMPKVLAEIQEDVKAGALVISIAAGIPIAAIEGKLPKARIVRSMPNTPALVGAGATAVSGGRARDGGRPRHRQADLRLGRDDDHPRRVPSGRHHRPLGKRARLHLPDHRGPVRRRRQGRAVTPPRPGAGRPDGLRVGQAADRDRGASRPSQGHGHVPRRDRHRRAARPRGGRSPDDADGRRGGGHATQP